MPMKTRERGQLLSRRAMLQQAGIGFAGASIPAGANEPAILDAGERPGIVQPAARAALAPLNRAPRMMQDYFVARVRQIEADGASRRAAVRTRRAAEAYVNEVRAKVRRCFGPWPEKTP